MDKKIKVLGIETSCDETAISILEVNETSGRVASNIVSSQIKLHAEFGGVVPNLAAREHVKNIDLVLSSALDQAGIKSISEIDLISVTRGPGLGPALIIGTTFARSIAWKFEVPIVGANHMRGHIHSVWLKKDGVFSIPPKDDPNLYPALALIVSGGHTELVLMNDRDSYLLIGETHDDAIGEAFDKVARLLDLGYPGGPAISKLANTGDSERFKLPLPMIHSGDFNFSYSGLKTAVLYLIRDLEKNGKITEQDKADIAASFQKTACEVVVRKTIDASRKYSAKTIILAGGVSANSTLRESLGENCKKEGLQYLIPELEYTTDNAAMVALAGYLQYLNKESVNIWDFRMDSNLLGYDAAFE